MPMISGTQSHPCNALLQWSETGCGARLVSASAPAKPRGVAWERTSGCDGWGASKRMQKIFTGMGGGQIATYTSQLVSSLEIRPSSGRGPKVATSWKKTMPSRQLAGRSSKSCLVAGQVDSDERWFCHTATGLQ